MGKWGSTKIRQEAYLFVESGSMLKFVSVQYIEALRLLERVHQEKEKR
jgi:hypothetical protein